MRLMDPTMNSGQFREYVDAHQQQHLLQFWDELTPAEQVRFAQQMADLDWNLVRQLLQVLDENSPGIPDAATIRPPSHVVRCPKSPTDQLKWDQAQKIGEQVLREGKVAAVLLAGGQGTRLGFPHPKGMFPIGPISGKSLFAILAEQIVSMSQRYGNSIPYLIMTSDGTHDETVKYFEQNNYFGVPRQDLFFFQQGFAPTLDLTTRRLFLAEKGLVSMSPDGHGGLLAALLKAGLFEELRRRGIEYLFSHQVDNPLIKACDPTFIGLHIQHSAEVSTKVVAKLGPDEKVGVAADQGGRTAIVEYSDLPRELAEHCEENGDLTYWAGSTAIHLFNVSFIENIATSLTSLPWHRAIKQVPYVDELGIQVRPETPNGVKFERFLFDTLPLAETALIVETLRDEEFAPLKNKSGDFSAEYVQARMLNLAIDWIESSGIHVPVDAKIEISPSVAMNRADVARHKAHLAALQFNRPIYVNHQLVSTSIAQRFAQPLMFDSHYRPQVWGGRALATQLARPLPSDGTFGEAWDLSSQSLHVSQVVDGPLQGFDVNELWNNHRTELAGNVVRRPFPLLIKWLECCTQLSVQVHPDDQLAQQLLNEPYGKSEAWVVISAEPTARVYAGLKPGVTETDVRTHLRTGTLTECLHSFIPQPGDCISLPAGTIHAAGGGLVVAEVQQSSDATFRLFDWNRLGIDGKLRPLQVDRALKAVNWNQGAIKPVAPKSLPVTQPDVIAEQLVDAPAFRLERFTIPKTLRVPYRGEMTIWMVLQGSGQLATDECGYQRAFIQGTTVLIPASAAACDWMSLDPDRTLQLLCVRL